MIQGRFSLSEALRAPEPPAEEGPTLAQRLQACARLLETAADELTALENGEMVRRRELTQYRDALAREVHPRLRGNGENDEQESVPGMGPDELLLLLPQEVAKLLAEALFALEERDEEERRMQDRWSSIEEDALKAMHVGGRIVSLRAGRYPDRLPADGKLDLRF